MRLTLTVLSFKNQPITEINPVVMGAEGGSIGRSNDNTLVLPDTEKFVSRHHATIKAEHGGYYLSDTSLSGVIIDGELPALNNATERLNNGTRLKIGEYELMVAIAQESASPDFPFTPEPATRDEPWTGLAETSFNRLMTDNFPRHEELIQTEERPVAFESALGVNQSPLFDSHIAPDVMQASHPKPIPETFSFDDLFTENNASSSSQTIDKPKVQDDFDDFFRSAVANISTNFEAVTAVTEPLKTTEIPTGPEVATLLETTVASPEKQPQTQSDSALFTAFLQGVAVECKAISPPQQAETLQRIGQMFRKLIDGTVAVLRSRAEFKSLCRVNMTVIRATDNNPLKFTVSTEDVLRQLIENKTEGFLSSTAAIEEAFNDIMNHQLAMQAGIQASLTDLLKTFDPKVIEKKFEQGIVLQKKAKCWDSYEETYRNTVEEAVENFFGDEFAKAYEQQMRLLKK